MACTATNMVKRCVRLGTISVLSIPAQASATEMLSFTNAASASVSGAISSARRCQSSRSEPSAHNNLAGTAISKAPSLIETSTHLDADQLSSPLMCTRQRRAHAIRHPKSSRQTKSKANPEWNFLRHRVIPVFFIEQNCRLNVLWAPIVWSLGSTSVNEQEEKHTLRKTYLQ